VEKNCEVILLHFHFRIASAASFRPCILRKGVSQHEKKKKKKKKIKKKKRLEITESGQNT